MTALEVKQKNRIEALEFEIKGLREYNDKVKKEREEFREQLITKNNELIEKLEIIKALKEKYEN